MVWLHLCEISRTDKSVEIESKLGVARCWGRNFEKWPGLSAKSRKTVPSSPSLAVMEHNPSSLNSAWCPGSTWVPQDTPQGTEAYTHVAWLWATLSVKCSTQTHWFTPYNSLKCIAIIPISNKETEAQRGRENWWGSPSWEVGESGPKPSGPALGSEHCTGK